MRAFQVHRGNKKKVLGQKPMFFPRSSPFFLPSPERKLPCVFGGSRLISSHRRNREKYRARPESHLEILAVLFSSTQECPAAKGQPCIARGLKASRVKRQPTVFSRAILWTGQERGQERFSDAMTVGKHHVAACDHRGDKVFQFCPVDVNYLPDVIYQVID